MTSSPSAPASTPSAPSLRARPRTPARAWRPARRAARRQALLRLAPALAAVLVVVAALVSGAARRPEPTAAWREAERALASAIAPGERMLVGTRVVRRHWGDHLRATHGVLVATDRRLLYVGILPPPLLSEVDGPPLVERLTFPYDTLLAVDVGSGLVRRGHGVVVRHGERKATFAIAPAARARAESIAAIAARARDAQRTRAERERFLQDSIAALPAPPPLLHVVQRGETIIGLAARYGFTPEELMERNGLTTDRLRAGQVLTVREFRRVGGVVEDF